VTRQKGRPLTEANTQSDDVTKLQYYLMAIPNDVSDEEKGERLEEVADVVTNVENSDVFLLAMWIGS
jgi:hypothetical protein